jgi:tetratricopeptide (TPR) repeat protein
LCERDGDYSGAEYYWRQGITVLENRGGESVFKIALIMRHIAAHQESPEEAISWLMDSLNADPDDRESYIKILQYYKRQEQETDTYKEWLDKSIKKFPNDLEVLNLAIKAATRNKAFKKAAQYAQALLKIDPVNTSAKQVLFTSHLAHARKLIKIKKFHLVEK